MYVELASVSLHAQLVEHFGLPEPTSSEMKELFGYYHFDNDTRYMSYDPRNQTWSVKSPNPSRSMRSDYDDVPRNKRAEFKECCHLLAMFSPQCKPADPSVATRGESFIHSSWIFAWFWFPELKRWELACLGNR